MKKNQQLYSVVVVLVLFLLVVVGTNGFAFLRGGQTLQPLQSVVYSVEPPPHQPLPEYRDPPLKKYRPQTREYQQVGLLLGDDQSTLPLYGKESRTRRNQWHYYTTTPGQQIYPLPIITTKDGRDCTEDIGCGEFYGNESVNVTGRDGVEFKSKLYRTENFPDFM